MRIRKVAVGTDGSFTITWETKNERGEWEQTTRKNGQRPNGAFVDAMNGLMPCVAKLLDMPAKADLEMSLASLALAYDENDAGTIDNTNAVLAAYVHCRGAFKPGKAMTPKLRTDQRRNPRPEDCVMSGDMRKAVETVIAQSQEHVGQITAA